MLSRALSLAAALLFAACGQPSSAPSRFAESPNIVATPEAAAVAALLQEASDRAKEGKSTEAAALYQRAVEQAERSSDRSLLGEPLLGLGVMQRRLGELDLAEQTYQRVLELSQELQHPGFECKARGRLGALLGQRLRSVEAIAMNRLALAQCERAQDLGEQAVLLLNIGAEHYELGQPREAREAYQEARELAEKSGAARVRAHVELNDGNLLFSLGRYRQARLRFDEALTFFQQLADHTGEVSVLESLARLCLLNSSCQPSGEQLRRMEDLAQELGDPRIQGRIRHVRALVLRQQGRLGEAITAFTAAASRRQQGKDVWGQAQSLAELGETLRLQGRLNEASTPLLEAHRISREAGDKTLEAVVQSRLARYYRDRGLLDQAAGMMEGALALLDEVNRSVPDPDSRGTQLAFRRVFFEEYVDLRARLDCRSGAGSCGSKALEASERGRARGLLDLLAEAQVDLSRNVEPRLLATELELKAELSKLDRQLLDLRRLGMIQNTHFDELSQSRSTAQQQLDLLEQQIRSQNPAYAALRYPKALGLEEIQRQLIPDDRTALLEYALGENGSYLFVVSSAGVATFPLGPAARLNELSLAFLTELSQAQDGASHAAAEALYRLLLRPAEKVLEGKDHLLLVPDGVLFSIPFEALVARKEAGGGARYVLEDRVISYSPSATVLAQLLSSMDGQESSGARASTFVAFADPFYPEVEPSSAALKGAPLQASRKADRLQLTKLAASRREVEDIAELFRLHGLPVVEPFIGREAREERVRQPEVGAAGYLHFAVHTLMENEDADGMGLILSQLPEDTGDGVLRFSEIFDLRLRTRLVVLSACGSGLGTPLPGEGFVGLSRAFFYAGAPTLAVSLWDVDDEATAKLMRAFYQRLLASDSEGAAGALQRAKLDLISAGEIAPRDWAGFVVVGVGGRDSAWRSR